MNRELISNALGNIDDEHIIKAADYHFISKCHTLERNRKMKTHTLSRFRPIFKVASVFVLIFSFSIVAYAANWFNLRDAIMAQLKIAPQTDMVPIATEDGETEFTETITEGRVVDILNLWGNPESPEYKATQEWYEYYWREDWQPVPDDEEVNDEIYNAYGAFSQEDFDKLDEICAKYGLKLHGRQNYSDGEIYELYNAVGCGNVLKEEAKHEYEDGYWYENGSFKIEGSVILPENTEHPVDYQLVRYVKGHVAIGAYLNIGDGEDYEQWEYTTSDGTSVVLLHSEEKDIVIANLENSLVYINVLDFSDESERNPAVNLEAFADTFDFSVIE